MAPTIGLVPTCAPPHSSVASLFENIANLLSRTFSVCRLPSYLDSLSPAGQAEAWRAFLSTSDIVITHDWRPYEWRLRLGLEVPICSLMLGLLPRGRAAFERYGALIRSYDRLTVSCTADGQICRRLLASAKAPITLLPFAVDTDHFKPLGRDERRRLRSLFDITDDEVVFLYVGRITAEKNVHTLLSLFALLLSRGPAARLFLVGRVKDARFHELGTGPYDLNQVLSQILAAHPHLGARVQMIPFTSKSDLPALFNLADVFVNMTLHHDENFGFAQAEAMSCSLPVISTRWGGLKDVVDHERTGLLVDTFVTGRGIRLDSWQALHHLERLARARAEREQLGRCGRARALARFSLPRFEENLLTEIRACLAAQQQPPARRRHRLSPFGRALAQAIGPVEERIARGHPIYDRRTYPLYAQLIAPYSSGPVPSAIPSQAMLFITQLAEALELRARCVRVHDPLWPALISIGRHEHWILGRLLRARSFLRRDELEQQWRRRRISRRSLATALRRLVEKGLVGFSAYEA
jgi:glycosyltransferase involved in cell wall biosynthesis